MAARRPVERHTTLSAGARPRGTPSAETVAAGRLLFGLPLALRHGRLTCPAGIPPAGRPSAGRRGERGTPAPPCSPRLGSSAARGALWVRSTWIAPEERGVVDGGYRSAQSCGSDFGKPSTPGRAHSEKRGARVNMLARQIERTGAPSRCDVVSPTLTQPRQLTQSDSK